jgi:methionyl aminopeptidase
LLNIDPSTAGPVFEGGIKDRRSELALSEVEGVNPEQALAFRLGSRRVDNLRVQMHISAMIIIKSSREIEQLKRSNVIVAEVFQKLKKVIAPGITTMELDQIAEEIILSKGATPAFKGYRGFPATLCISINEEVVHGIPSQRRLKEGDIVSIDVGSNLDGYFGDGAITLPVGEVDRAAQRLLEVTERALYIGIEKAKVGNRLFDISYAIQTWVESHGFSVVRDFVGHGIGMDLHEEPQIPNFGSPHQGPRLERGMVFALEPMVNEGTYEVKILSDGWTVVTADGKRSAHFEHTIAITDGGAEILSEL